MVPLAPWPRPSPAGVHGRMTLLETSLCYRSYLVYGHLLFKVNLLVVAHAVYSHVFKYLQRFLMLCLNSSISFSE